MVRKTEHMFGKIDLTPLSLSILTYLARNPGKEFYIRELVGILGCSLGGCYEALERLHKQGIVKKRKSGRNSYYTINEDFPALKQFKVFINVLEVQKIIGLLKDDVDKVVLYGSCAIGEDKQASDIDLFILTKDVKLIRDRIKDILNGREVKPYITTPQKLIVLKNKDPAFYKEINNGIVLWHSGASENEQGS